MKNIILLLLISLLPSIIKAQETNYIPYYLKVYEADSLYLNNNFKESHRILDSLFQKYEPLNINGLNEYGTYVVSGIMIGKTDDIKDKIQYGLENFYSIGIFHKDIAKHSDSIYKYEKRLTEKEIADFRESYKRNVDFKLRKQITDMVEEDQAIRNVENIDFDLLTKVTQKHELILKNIFKKYGFPSKKLMGNYNLDNKEDDFNLLLMHTDIYYTQSLFDFLFEAVKDGKFSPEQYASVYDKTLQSTEKQRFGTFWKNATELSELENPEKVNTIRKKIGLPSIEYAKWKQKYIRDVYSKMQSGK